RPFSSLYLLFPHAMPTEIYTLSLHDALPIWSRLRTVVCPRSRSACRLRRLHGGGVGRRRRVVRDRGHLARLFRRRLCRRAQQFVDRKSTRLNSSHVAISYAVFCLKKKT